MQPYFHSLSEFIAMGKHGIYVWMCWGMVFAVIIALIVYSRQQRINLLKDIKRQAQREKQRKQAQHNAKSKKANHQHDDTANNEID